MNELFIRIGQAKRQIPTIKNKVARKDLQKMVSTVDRALATIDMESVECRRLHKETPRYKELVQHAEQLITNLEQHLTFAVLLGG